MLKFGDAVIKDNTDWLIYTPDRYVNIRYNMPMPPWWVQASGVSSAKAGSTVTVTISESQPLQELWNGKLFIRYTDKDGNEKLVNVTGRTFTVPTDVHAYSNLIYVSPGYIPYANINYEGIIRFDFAELDKYMYVSKCYPYVQSGTKYYVGYDPSHSRLLWNYSSTGISYFNANPPQSSAEGGGAGEGSDSNQIDTFGSTDVSRTYTILNIGDRATLGTADSFSFRYKYIEDITTNLTVRSYRRVNSLVTGETDVLIDTESFTTVKDTYLWNNKVTISI